MSPSSIERYAREPSTFAKRFFWLCLIVFGIGGVIAHLLIECNGDRQPYVWGSFPPSFLGSSLLLAIGSLSLHRSMWAVKLEKSLIFRRSLAAAMVSGTTFIGLQSFGLWCLIRNTRAEDASTGVNPFIVVLSVLHGMHFSVALMFLTYVTIKAYAARYDHEYYWGVQVCAWFWHGLGLAWMGILGVFAITSV